MARLWLWRFAMLASSITALFFVWTAVAPVGGPVFDAVTLRARFWATYGFGLVQICGVCLWVIFALTAGRWARGAIAFAAAVVLLGCVMAMLGEYGSLIRGGILRDPIEVAQHKLMVSRAITLTLAVVSLALGWWARPKRRV